jgi:predicted secreted hydrolase
MKSSRQAYRAFASGLFLLACACAVCHATQAKAESPEGWQAFKINDKKKLTVYRTMDDAGAPVVHARAEASPPGSIAMRRPALRIAPSRAGAGR